MCRFVPPLFYPLWGHVPGMARIKYLFLEIQVHIPTGDKTGKYSPAGTCTWKMTHFTGNVSFSRYMSPQGITSHLLKMTFYFSQRLNAAKSKKSSWEDEKWKVKSKIQNKEILNSTSQFIKIHNEIFGFAKNSEFWWIEKLNWGNFAEIPPSARGPFLIMGRWSFGSPYPEILATRKCYGEFRDHVTFRSRVDL